ncbi:MAG: DUF6884 domain-containing protein [Ktedonobacterales bacterium]
MATTIALIAASRRQRGTICRAADQYDLSPVFRRARDFCERTYAEWYILSARHYVLSPLQVIGPDDTHVSILDANDRDIWAEHVARALIARQERSAERVHFALYASQRYADLLQRAAPTLTFELPLSGLGLVERLRWFDQRLRVRSRVLAR